jgi:hypothetical protein
MNTPAHLILAAAVFAKPSKPKVTWAALIGGFLPDLSLYGLAAWSMFVQGNSASYVFDTQYFSEQWQSIFAVDNSFFVWGLIIALGISLKKNWLWALGGAGFLHLLFDFPLHHDDARQHFWPLTEWIFKSPFSYWDNNHHGHLIGMLELGMCAVLLAVLWRRFSSKLARGVIVVVALLQIAPPIIFGLMFSS